MQNSDLVNTYWVLEKMGSEKVNSEIESTIRFNEGNHISGNTGCNRYFGTYEFSKGFRISALGVTKKLCTTKKNEREQKFLDVFENANIIELKDKKLILKTEDSKKYLVFSLAKN